MRGPDGECTGLAQQPEATEPEWERVQKRLGAPDDPRALDRARELVEAGWELVGVRFTSGVWVFRRRRPE